MVGASELFDATAEKTSIIVWTICVIEMVMVVQLRFQMLYTKETERDCASGWCPSLQELGQLLKPLVLQGPDNGHGLSDGPPRKAPTVGGGRVLLPLQLGYFVAKSMLSLLWPLLHVPR